MDEIRSTSKSATVKVGHRGRGKKRRNSEAKVWKKKLKGAVGSRAESKR